MRFLRRAPRRSWLFAVLAAVAASAFAVSLSFGSSHREAPSIALDPTADDTDVYAFKANDAPGSLTVVANWIPFEDPAGGPNFYNFDPKAHYYVHVDNNGDGAYDLRYQFAFKTTVVNKNSFAYATPTVESLNDPHLNVRQTYTITREVYKKGKKKSQRVIARDLPVVPSNIGPKTMPHYDALAAEGIKTLPGRGKVVAGPR